ncbi:MAG TPA: tetratricopeptide repeat protein, partial [Polyangia bacterium]|nr:tetratricopeptide repeat protein [Polyangia bacterium]
KILGHMRMHAGLRFPLRMPSAPRLAGAGVLAACALAAGLSGGVAQASDYTKVYAEGLRHSRKAAALAGANNCKAAVPEYTKALHLLKDPVLLFNRAECYRTLGDRDAALADYRRFLVEMPGAPNRARVEAHIVTLEAAGKPAAAEPKIVTAPVPASAAPVLDPAPIGDAPLVAAKVPDQGVGRPHIDLDERPADRQPPSTGLDIVRYDPAPMPLGNQDAEVHRGVTSQWWFWTTIAAVIVGGGVATYFVLRSDGTDIPPSALGNVRF